MKVDFLDINRSRTKRKTILIMLMVALSTLTINCARQSNQNNEEVNTHVQQNEEIIEEETYYRITYRNYMYGYYIYDSNHNLVKSETGLVDCPRIVDINDDILRITTQAGTGIVTQNGYYYDIKNNVFSEKFSCIFDQTNAVVACGESNRIVIKNMWDEKRNLQEITTFKEAFSVVAFPFVDVKFIENADKIEVTYLSGDDYREITEVFDVSIEN